MLTKGAIGNLINRYRAVLKKCNLINTFGSLAVASMLVLGGAGVAEATYDLTELPAWQNQTEATLGSKNVDTGVDKGEKYYIDMSTATSNTYVAQASTTTVTTAGDIWLTSAPSSYASFDVIAGLYVSGKNAIGRNTGNIYVNPASGGFGDYARGISVNEGAAYNSGLIYVKTTSTTSGYGMYDQSDKGNSPITMVNEKDGIIISEGGQNVVGMAYYGGNTDDVVRNDGLIVARYKNANGVKILNGKNKTFTNNGSIIAVGKAYGVYSDIEGSKIINNGLIEVQKDGTNSATGIRVSGSSYQVINEKEGKLLGSGTLVEARSSNGTLINRGQIGSEDQQGNIDASRASNFMLILEDGSNVNALFNLKTDANVKVSNLTRTDQELNLGQGTLASFEVTNSTFTVNGVATTEGKPTQLTIGKLTADNKTILNLASNSVVVTKELSVDAETSANANKAGIYIIGTGTTAEDIVYDAALGLVQGHAQLDGTTILKSTVHAIKGDADSIITNSGNLTVTSGSVANFLGSYTQQDGSITLNKEGDFFGGKVDLQGGTMTAHTVNADKLTFGAATLHATEALNLKGANLTVGDKATLIVGNKLDNAVDGNPSYQGGGITFGENGTITVNGGTFIADANVVLDDKFVAKDGMAAGIVGTKGDVKLDLADYSGEAVTLGTFTRDQYKAAKKSILESEDEAAIFSFLNAKVVADAEVEKGESIVVGSTVTDGKAILGANAVPTWCEEGVAYASAPDGFGDADLYYNNEIVITKATDPTNTAVDVNSINAGAAKFDAGALVVGNGSGETVKVEFGAGSDITISGVAGSAIMKAPVDSAAEGAENTPVKMDAAIVEGATFTFGHENNKGKDGKAVKQTGIFGKVDIAGDHIVHGNGAEHTQASYGNMVISGKGDVRVLHASVKVGELNMSGGRFFLDPAYASVASLNLTSGEVVVGKGSVAEIGRVENLEQLVKDAGMSTTPGAIGFTVGDSEAVLALGTAMTIGNNGKLIVDPSKVNEPELGTPSGTGDGSAIFAKGSLFVVDSAIAQTSPALTGTGTLSVDKDAKLYLVDAQAGKNYTIADFARYEQTSQNAGPVANETWDKIITNSLTDAELVKDSDGNLVLKVETADMSETLPGVLPVAALTELSVTGADSAAAEAGKKFLSLVIDPEVVAQTAQVDTINEVSRAAVTAGVQNTSLRIADAASNTVLDHMSFAGKIASVHTDGADFWAAPMYGNLYTNGMVTAGSSVRGQFGGLALGADVEAGKFLGGQFRVGAAINGGGGQSEAKGNVTSTQNDYDFGGLNFYASWNKGALNVIGTVGYGFGNHEVSMGLPSSMGMGSAKADIDTSVFTADLRAEYQIKTDWVDVLPHAGIRYTSLQTNAHDLNVGGSVLNSVASDTQNIVQFPIGVTLSKDFTFADWNVKPLVDVSVIPAVGDKKATTKVNFSGLDAVDSVNTRIMDSTSWAGTVGVQAEKGNLTLGLNYGVQASSNETDQNVQVKLGWKF